MVLKKGCVDIRNSSSAQRPDSANRSMKSSGHFFEADRLGTSANALREHIMRERALYNARTASDNSWAWVSTHSRDFSSHSFERDCWEKEEHSSCGLSADGRITKFPASPPTSPPAQRQKQKQQQQHKPSQVEAHLKRSNETLRQLFRAERKTLNGLLKQEKPGRLQVAPAPGRQRAI